MKVILLKNVENVGLPGETAEVKPGHYRNFLLPRGWAVEATRGNLKMLQSRRQKLSHEAETIVKEADEIGAKLKEVTLTFIEKASDNERLFGSVTPADIADKLTAEGFDIHKRHVALSEPIKSVGSFQAMVKLHSNVSVPVKVVVEAIDDGPAEAAEEPMSEPAVEEENGTAEEEAAPAESSEESAEL